jgi:hypothetical protein
MKLWPIYILFVLAGGVFLFLAFKDYVNLIQPEGDHDVAAFQANVKWNLIAAAACIVPAEVIRRIVLFRRRRHDHD